MSTQINFTTSSGNRPPSVVEPIKKPPADEKLASLIQTVITKKEENVQSALNGRVNVSEAILIGGDAFTMGYLAFQGVQIIKPSLASIPTIGFATLVCGVVAGAINIGVALVCLQEAIQAYKNGDEKLALRLFIDFATFTAIGLIMILTSLATQVAALGGLGAFFAANPWLLPVLFFIVSIPVIIEISNRIFNIHTNKDLAAQLKTDNLDNLLKGTDTKNPFHLQPLIHMLDQGEDHKVVLGSLSEKMEKLQADMGVIAALETFKLMQKILRKEALDKQMEVVKNRITEWNNAQYVRLFQQVLYTAAFGISMAALSPKMNTPAVNATMTFAMAGANAVPLYMDIVWPFKRNTPIVVPKVET